MDLPATLSPVGGAVKVEPIGKLRESVVNRNAARGLKVQGQLRLCIGNNTLGSSVSQKAMTSADILVIFVIR